VVCNGRSLFGSSDTSGHGPEKLRKIFDTSIGAWHLTRGRDLPAFRLGIAKVPGTGRRDEICQHFDWGSQRCLAPGAGTRFASISIGDRKGARLMALTLMTYPGARHVMSPKHVMC
jgi:hypothetical protein